MNLVEREQIGEFLTRRLTILEMMFVLVVSWT